MKTVEEIRQARLKQLKEEFGTWVALNGLLGYTERDSTLSQYANASKSSKSDKPKGMGSDIARQLETVCNKPRGWMDNDPDLDKPGEAFSAEVQEFAGHYARLSQEDRAKYLRVIRAMQDFDAPPV